MENLSRIRSTGVSRSGPAFGEAGTKRSRAFPIDTSAMPLRAANPSAGGDEDPMLYELERRDRLRLVEFVCSFAWADFEIRPEERVFIADLIRRLELSEEDNLQVQQWLDRPPGIDHLDPTSIPAEHRRIFVESIEGLVASDGEVSDEERESLEIFKQLLVD